MPPKIVLAGQWAGRGRGGGGRGGAGRGGGAPAGGVPAGAPGAGPAAGLAAIPPAVPPPPPAPAPVAAPAVGQAWPRPPRGTAAREHYKHKLRISDRHDRANRGEYQYDRRSRRHIWNIQTIPWAGATQLVQNWPGIIAADYIRTPANNNNVANPPVGPLYPVSDEVLPVNEVLEWGYRGPATSRQMARRRARAMAWLLRERDPRRVNAHRQEANVVQFVKILGWGGQGVAALFMRLDPAWSWRHPARGPPPQFYVGKCRLDGNVDRSNDEGVATEVGEFYTRPASRASEAMDAPLPHGSPANLMGMYQNFLRAKHVIQILEEARTNAPPLWYTQVLLLEYAPRGNLFKVINKASGYKNENPHPLPDKALWLWFKCLFRMAVALKYPPKHWTNFQGATFPLVGGNPPTLRNLVDEDLPNPAFPGLAGVLGTFQHNLNNTDYAHFDMDPGNVLVGDFEAGHPEHQIAQVLKLNDFGLLEDVANIPMPPSQDPGNPSDWWRLRSIGKAEWWAPEQFSPEWNYICAFPPRNQPNPAHNARVAGNYSYKLNIWGIGFIMWSLITRCYPPKGRRPDDHPAFQPPNAGPNQPRRWTHGAYLFDPEFDNVDYTLRRLVARCMADDPADRPDLPTLQRHINVNLGRPRNAWADDRSQDDTVVKAAMSRFVDHPGYERAYSRPDLEKWLASAPRPDPNNPNALRETFLNDVDEILQPTWAKRHKGKIKYYQKLPLARQAANPPPPANPGQPGNPGVLGQPWI
ncbi:hypothetical protein QBC47DRAFT_410737 [Echria macrotheca]|uniref:Protein kinase domain-containing protein n=1 Tax=Echria macrotheca TaxID=438768 RepID=A0AAJ0BGV3_9PEZI|nr:hypothetical protein QBC47DRAFT_410737 [Echria macrotheca]